MSLYFINCHCCLDQHMYPYFCWLNRQLHGYIKTYWNDGEHWSFVIPLAPAPVLIICLSRLPVCSSWTKEYWSQKEIE